jgi:hypothetical protein
LAIPKIGRQFVVVARGGRKKARPVEADVELETPALFTWHFT